MKYFYGKKNGKIVQLAKIYTQSEHTMSNRNIDQGILRIIKVLHQKGHRTYIVGGAIRDFLLHRIPKDFDIVTDATPNQIRKYFYRAEIVGKRFPIVLVPMQKSNYVEISTFRSQKEIQRPQKKSNKKKIIIDKEEFGSISEDVTRRDFTCNALYFCPIKEEILDFVDGVIHIQKKKLIPIRKKFSEDPVRLIRAIKYAYKCSLTLPLLLKLQIYQYAPLLQTVPHSRISDETMKILLSGASREILTQCFKYRLLKYMLPNVYRWYKKNPQAYKQLLINLHNADVLIQKPYSRIRGWQMFTQEYIKYIIPSMMTNTKKKHLTRRDINLIMKEVKDWLYPISPPNNEVYSAIVLTLKSLQLVSKNFRSQYDAKFNRVLSKRNKAS